MICYRDITFCSSNVKVHTCGREFTKEDAKKAEIWWGSKDYPVAYGEFCDVQPSFNYHMGSVSQIQKDLKALLLHTPRHFEDDNDGDTPYVRLDQLETRLELYFEELDKLGEQPNE